MTEHLPTHFVAYLIPTDAPLKCAWCFIDSAGKVRPLSIQFTAAQAILRDVLIATRSHSYDDPEVPNTSLLLYDLALNTHVTIRKTGVFNSLACPAKPSKILFQEHANNASRIVLLDTETLAESILCTGLPALLPRQARHDVLYFAEQRSDYQTAIVRCLDLHSLQIRSVYDLPFNECIAQTEVSSQGQCLVLGERHTTSGEKLAFAHLISETGIIELPSSGFFDRTPAFCPEGVYCALVDLNDASEYYITIYRCSDGSKVASRVLGSSSDWPSEPWIEWVDNICFAVECRESESSIVGWDVKLRRWAKHFTYRGFIGMFTGAIQK